MTSRGASPTQPQPAPGRHFVACAWFWAWAVVGAIGAFGLVSFGVLGLVPAMIARLALSRHRVARRSMFGQLAGAGLVFLFVAYVLRQGPGTTCWHTATASGCDQHLDPLPWLASGLLLVIGGFGLQLRHR